MVRLAATGERGSGYPEPYRVDGSCPCVSEDDDGSFHRKQRTLPSCKIMNKPCLPTAIPSQTGSDGRRQSFDGVPSLRLNRRRTEPASPRSDRTTDSADGFSPPGIGAPATNTASPVIAMAAGRTSISCAHKSAGGGAGGATIPRVSRATVSGKECVPVLAELEQMIVQQHARVRLVPSQADDHVVRERDLSRGMPLVEDVTGAIVEAVIQKASRADQGAFAEVLFPRPFLGELGVRPDRGVNAQFSGVQT